jgi:hypothetical protein
MNTIPTPFVPFLRMRVLRKMEENLKGFLVESGCKVDSVKFIGD